MGRAFNALAMLTVLSVAYALGRIKGREEALYAVAVGKEVLKNESNN